jgi:hypothetical protein
MQTSKKPPSRSCRHDSKKVSPITASATRTPASKTSGTKPSAARNRKKSAARTRHYDPEMIRDFLTQLRCELQNDELEHSGPVASNQETVGQLEPFVKKYGTRLLYKIAFEDVTEDQRVDINQTMASARQKQLAALDMLLESAFKEALAAASHESQAGAEKSIRFSADDWKKWTRNGTP